MRILIGGGAGYIGSVLVPRLLERGYDVDVIDLMWFGNYLPDKARVIKQNLMSVKESDLEPYDQVIFLAGLSNDPMAEYSPARNFIENGAAPAYLAYLAKRASVKRFIYGGSCSVYGYTVNELYDETAMTTPDFPYGISKLQGEFGALQLKGDDFSVICFRKGTLSGYSPRMRLDLVVNTMFKCAVEDGVIVVNNPAIWRPILAIQDAASAYIRAIEAPEDISGVFNIASANYTVGEVADCVKLGVQNYLDINAKIEIHHIQDFRNYKVTTEKAHNVLSFRPRYDVEAIVGELAEYLDEFKDFENPYYYNLMRFRDIADKQEFTEPERSIV